MGFVLELKICVGKRMVETTPKKMREKKWMMRLLIMSFVLKFVYNLIFLIEELIVG